MLCKVMICYATSRYVTLCYVMLRYVTLCNVTLRYVMLCYVMVRNVMICYVMLRYVMLCFVANQMHNVYLLRVSFIVMLVCYVIGNCQLLWLWFFDTY